MMRPNAANHLFGFASWAITKTYMGCFWPQYKPPPEKINPNAPVSMFQKLLMTKMKFQRRMCEETLGGIFNVHRGTINKWARRCSPMWGEVGRFLSILPLNEDYLIKQMPENFDLLGLSKVAGMPDGKDIMTDTYRLNNAFTKAMHSDKVHHSAARYIAWITSSGLACEHSPLFMGRSSETSIVRIMGKYLVKIPLTWLILADRGFYRDVFHYPNLNVHLTPSFLKGRDQFTEVEVAADRKKCEARYTSETAFSRVTDTTALQDVVPRTFFCYMQDMVDWGQANVNLGAPMQFPADTHLPPGYFDEAKSKSVKTAKAKVASRKRKKANFV